MKSLGFDPGALARINGIDALAEVYLARTDEGALLIVGETDDGHEFSVRLRADFLDAFIAARDAAAA